MGALDVVIKLTADGADSVRGAMSVVGRAVNGVTDDIENAQEKTRRLREELENARSGGASIEEISQRTQDLDDHLSSAAGRAGQLQERLEGLRAGGAALAALGAGGIVLANSLAEAGREGQAVDAALEAMMKKRGEGGRFEELGDWAGKLAHDAALVDDDPIKQAAAGLMGFGVSAEQVMQIMPGLIGQSRLYHQSLDSVAMSFGKAFASGSAGALTKSGVTLDKADLEKLSAIEDPLEKQKLLFKMVKESMDKYALSITEGMGEGEIAANRAKLAQALAMGSIEAGAADAKVSIDNLTASAWGVVESNEAIGHGTGVFLTLGSYAAAAVGGVVSVGSQIGLLALTFPALQASATTAWASVTAGAATAGLAIGAILALVALATTAIAGLWVAWKGSQDAGTMSDAELKKKWGPLGDFWVSASGSDQDQGATVEDRASYEAAKKAGLVKGKTFEQWRGVSVDPSNAEPKTDPVAEAKAKADKAMKDAGAAISGAQMAAQPLPPTSAVVEAQTTAPSVTAAVAPPEPKRELKTESKAGEKLLDLLLGGAEKSGANPAKPRKTPQSRSRETASDSGSTQSETEREPSIADTFSFLRRGGSIFDLDKANAKGAASTSQGVSRETNAGSDTQTITVRPQTRVSQNAVGKYLLEILPTVVEIPGGQVRAR